MSELPPQWNRDWREGYFDALDGRSLGMRDRSEEYRKGFAVGYEEIVREREELDRSGSSNT